MAKITQPQSPQAVERRLGRSFAQLQQQIATEYIRRLQGVTTAAEVEALGRAMSRKYGQTPPSILDLIETELSKTLTLQQTAFASVAVSQAGIAAELAAQATLPVYVENTALWVADLNSQSISRLTDRTLAAIQAGKTLDDVLAEVREGGAVNERHARFLARNQTQNFNAISTKARVEELGVTKAIWRSSQDERVRESHRARDGQEFDLKKGLYSPLDGLALIPGIDYNCRCVAEYIIPDEAFAPGAAQA